jgi:hydroxyethylthiazole kinase-like uncharacterized protein yjeF
MLLVTPSQMQALDRRAIEDFSIPGLILMENAGRGVSRLIERRFADRLSLGVVVLAGPGNNGGDGFVIARHLHQARIKVHVLALIPKDRFSGDARTNCEIVQRLGIPILECLDSGSLSDKHELCRNTGIIVDALFGTGLARDVTGRFAEAIEIANRSPAPIVAVDMPSGLSAETGRPLGTAVLAHLTATMGLAKVGQVIHPGVEYVGELHVIDIGIPASAVAEADIRNELLDIDSFRALRHPRPSTGHKGTFGHLLILSGSRGKAGAAALAARGALRAGAGLVTVAVPVGLQPILMQKLTEAMTEGLPETATGTISHEALRSIETFLEKKKALAIGPGLGLESETVAVVRHILESVPLPIVADADALTALGTEHRILTGTRGPRILTPHPGEMATMLGRSVAEIQNDRVEAARRLARVTGAITVLKGARTIIATPDGRVAINPTGNAGMGTGGMGDVLTGIIGGLLAQGHDAWNAARLGVFAHGMAADGVAQTGGPYGYLAGEVADWLPRIWAL